MKELSPIENLFAVEVPEDAQDFQLLPRFSRETGEDFIVLVWWNNFGHSTQKDLPNGFYEILFTTKDCSEEQAGSVVENDIHPMLDYILGWRDYSFKYENFCLEYAKESLQSLLRANGLDESKNFLLIKKTS